LFLGHLGDLSSSKSLVHATRPPATETNNSRL
jgi:hypothetical protein